jgi:hypothetical protein
MGARVAGPTGEFAASNRLVQILRAAWCEDLLRQDRGRRAGLRPILSPQNLSKPRLWTAETDSISRQNQLSGKAVFPQSRLLLRSETDRRMGCIRTVVIRDDAWRQHPKASRGS